MKGFHLFVSGTWEYVETFLPSHIMTNKPQTNMEIASYWSVFSCTVQTRIILKDTEGKQGCGVVLVCEQPDGKTSLTAFPERKVL